MDKLLVAQTAHTTSSFIYFRQNDNYVLKIYIYFFLFSSTIFYTSLIKMIRCFFNIDINEILSKLNINKFNLILGEFIMFD